MVSGTVFSDRVLDLLVHRPELPLYDDSSKVGVGLWNFPIPAFLREIAFLFGGMYLYLRTTEAITSAGHAMWVVRNRIWTTRSCPGLIKPMVAISFSPSGQPIPIR